MSIEGYRRVQNEKEEEMRESDHSVIHQEDRIVDYLLVFSEGLWDAGIGKVIYACGKITREAASYMFYVLGQSFFRAFIFYFLSSYGDSKINATYGICYSFQTIQFKSICLSLQDKIGIDLSQQLGAENYSGVRRIFSQGIITSTIFFCVFTLPLSIWAKSLLTAIGIDSDLADSCQNLLRLMIPGMMLELTSGCIRAFCMSQGRERPFGNFAIINTICSTFISYLLIARGRYGLNGFIIGIIFMETANLAFSIYTIRQCKEETLGFPPLDEVIKGIFEFIYESLKFCSSLYMEYIGFETASLFVALTHDNNQISAISSSYAFASICFQTGSSFSSIGRTRINILIGKKLSSTAKNVWKMIYFLSLSIGWFLSIVIFANRNSIAGFYASNLPETQIHLLKLIKIYSIFCPFEMSICTVIIGLRSIGKAHLSSLFSIIYLVLVNNTINLILYANGLTEDFYYFTSVYSTYLLFNLTGYSITTVTDWKEISAPPTIEADIKAKEPTISFNKEISNSLISEGIAKPYERELVEYRNFGIFSICRSLIYNFIYLLNYFKKRFQLLF